MSGHHGGSGGSQVTGTSADGYTVTINADKLAKAATDTDGSRQDTLAMHKHLQQTLVPAQAFGTLPHAPTVASALLASFNDHVNAVNSMGLSLGELGGRIQYAAEQGFDSEPVTRKVATLNAPSGWLTSQQANPTPGNS